MFVFVFVRALFRLRANTPEFDVLFQFPPRRGIRFQYGPRVMYDLDSST